MLHRSHIEVYEAPRVADSIAVKSRVLRRQQPKTIPPPPRFQFAAPRAQLPPVYLTAHHSAISEMIDPKSTTIPPSKRNLFPNEFDENRIKRMEARWKKLGINLDKINFNYGNSRQSQSEEIEQKTPKSNRFLNGAMPKYSTKSAEKNGNGKTVVVEQRVSHRPRINGPLLRSIDEEKPDEDTSFGSNFPPKSDESFGSGIGFESAQFGGNRFGSRSPSFPGEENTISEGDEEVDPDEEGEEEIEEEKTETKTEVKTDIPVPIKYPVMEGGVTPPSPGAYHSRTTPIYRHFQFTQQLAQRPRLHIRRPGEPRAEGIQSANVEDLPNLTPYMNNARHKYGYDKQPALQQIFPQQVMPRTMPPPMPVQEIRPSPPPTTTLPPFEQTEDTEDSGLGFGDSGIVGEGQNGESDAGVGGGAGFDAPSELPPELANIGFGLAGGNGIGLNVAPEEPKPTPKPKPQPKRPRQRKPPMQEVDKDEKDFVIPEDSGLRPVSPPKEFFEGATGSFGSGSGSPFLGGSGSFGGGGRQQKVKGAQGKKPKPKPQQPSSAFEQNGSDLFSGDSALMPSKGPSGDGYGLSVPDGEAVPPMVPAVSRGGAAAGIPPPEFQEFQSARTFFETTENPHTTVKPSALLNVLNRADQGFNQAITHFERGTPVEAAAIDILEVALGSQKLDSQAKLLGHVDRALGLDNLQRLQRWANTAGALDMLKEQVVKIAKNYQPPEDLLPTIPPQFEYLFKPTGR
ncbi:unnamed protein product, partial [Mesorhabditis belari]|uniref:Uncharacterized protein n=1 Tax=Mesorhabditis belari TaxID=2138241 RepID=A0AAF3FQ92_9BILA